MIATCEAARAGLFQPQYWLNNVVSGVIVGVVALPLAMAFAIASGVKPEQGIYTAMIAGACVSLLGGCRIQIAGPTGAFIAILAGITASHGVQGLMIATLMAGVMLIALGLARLGTAIRFIPHPVIVGFTAGIGVIIWVGQWADFFGLPKPSGHHFHEKLLDLLNHLSSMQPATTGLASLSIALCVYGPKLPGLHRVPGPLIAMLSATVLQAYLHTPGVATIASAFGGIPSGLPQLTIPPLHLDQIITLIPAAFTIAMLGAIESLLSAVVADGMADTQHDANQELIAQGIANVLAPLFGGFAATGAIARTATNFRNGGNSPLAGVVHSLTLLLILLVLAPLAGQIPLCALAAILFVVAWNMSDVPHFVRMFRIAPRADVAIMLVTFLLTVFADLVIAVNIGVILAMLQFVRRMSSSVQVLTENPEQLNITADTLPSAAGAVQATPVPNDTLIYTIDGPFFFGAVDNLESALQHTGKLPKTVIIRLNRVPFIDATGLHALHDTVLRLERRHVRVILCEASTRVLRKLRQAEIVPQSNQPPRYFGNLSEALDIAPGIVRSTAEPL